MAIPTREPETGGATGFVDHARRNKGKYTFVLVLAVLGIIIANAIIV